ncbi:MAG: RHS repeat-associated core domain-containing protein [Hyphomonadaceae bacterium]|nr:RHS repeat-associated core domain-containing protein [Hyphomonadaceae bacterium]
MNAYDEYGLPAATNVGRFQYTGQMWLAEAQLYHYKARAYLPQLGRFAQTDPIGMAGGVNLYGYVGNDPVNWIDPSGKRLWVALLPPLLGGGIPATAQAINEMTDDIPGINTDSISTAFVWGALSAVQIEMGATMMSTGMPGGLTMIGMGAASGLTGAVFVDEINNAQVECGCAYPFRNAHSSSSTFAPSESAFALGGSMMFGTRRLLGWDESWSSSEGDLVITAYNQRWAYDEGAMRALGFGYRKVRALLASNWERMVDYFSAERVAERMGRESAY